MLSREMRRREFVWGSSMGAVLSWGSGWPLAAAERAPQLKITEVVTYHLRHQLPRAIGPSTAYYKERDTLLVKIATDAGLVGWGETAVLPGIRGAVHDLGKSLIGQNPLEHRRLWRQLWGPNFGNGLAVGALDIALHDLRGKALNLSITDMYGGRLRDRIPVYAAAMNYTEGVDPESQYPPEAAKLVERGFQAMKMRLGGLPLQRDIETARRVREAVGPKVRLLVDGNGAYTMGGAVRMGRALEELDFYLFEEPLPQSPNYAGYEILTSQLDIPIAAGEVVDSRSQARDLINRRCMRIIQPDATLCGGIGECLFIAELARLHGIHCIPHCWGSAMAIAATIQVLALLPPASWARTTETPMLELDVYENPFREELVKQPVTIRDGHVAVPTGPGLGIEVNEEVIAKYQVRD